MQDSNASWVSNPIAVFDLETTGLNVREDRIVTASFGVLSPSGEVMCDAKGVPIIRDWLINPGVVIPKQASDIHGVTTLRAQKEGMGASEGVAQVAAMVGWALRHGIPVVGYNVRYDLSMLVHETERHPVERHGVEPLPELFPILDPYPIFKHLHKYRKGSKTLANAAEFYGINLNNAHSSHEDALAAGRILQAIGAQNQVFRNMTAGELHQTIIELYDEQDRDYQEYLMRNHVEKQSPLRVVERGFPTYLPESQQYTLTELRALCLERSTPPS